MGICLFWQPSTSVIIHLLHYFLVLFYVENKFLLACLLSVIRFSKNYEHATSIS